MAAPLKELGIDRNSPEQKAWEAYRDAQLKAIYPATDNDTAEYGSVYPMCPATLKKRLTEGRIRDLKGLTTSMLAHLFTSFQVLHDVLLALAAVGFFIYWIRT